MCVGFVCRLQRRDGQADLTSESNKAKFLQVDVESEPF